MGLDYRRDNDENGGAWRGEAGSVENPKTTSRMLEFTLQFTPGAGGDIGAVNIVVEACKAKCAKKADISDRDTRPGPGTLNPLIIIGFPSDLYYGTNGACPGNGNGNGEHTEN
ncbi:hypothetical protein GWI33_008141 [Rhynchophorus ferrugineus]|uniref:Uncharacterized protein n=1 Tax=Rhynchophorus ferrugineus TaxID=354439 RepID=A0A834MBA5_RHYFE|nr:hypothetical protein GWI33_008141 [Rhynchophorus ferrugineus]